MQLLRHKFQLMKNNKVFYGDRNTIYVTFVASAMALAKIYE